MISIKIKLSEKQSALRELIVTTKDGRSSLLQRSDGLLENIEQT